MYQRILIPTDGSVGTAHVALQAIDLAEQYGAAIHVVHVVDEGLEGLVDGLSGEETLEAQGRRAVERAEQMATAHGVDVTTAIEKGDPAERIVTYADEIDADLIVVGTHGRTGIERRVIGSVAERIVRRATSPVMTVRLPETDVTVDDEQDARDVARRALDEDDIEATVTDVERQLSVWIVEAAGDDGSYIVYIDPETQRTSIIESA